MMIVMELDTNKFKGLLEAEKAKLEAELATIGRKNPNNPEDWEAVQGETNVDYADRNEMGDAIEQYEENTGILKQLETRLNNVNKSLQAIEEGTYGICSVSGQPIELDRLEANPAAQTCKAHMNDTSEG